MVYTGTYREFLRSRYWRAVRRRVIAVAPWCDRCGCHNNLQVHHVRYDQLGSKAEYYKFRDLEVLCRSCHAEHHGHPAPERDWSGPEHISTILLAVLQKIPRRAA